MARGRKPRHVRCSCGGRTARGDRLRTLRLDPALTSQRAPTRCGIGLCIAAPWRRCGRMKTANTMPTVGSLVPPVGQRLFRSWLSGGGSVVWNAVSTWGKPRRAPLRLHPPSPFRRPHPASRFPPASLALRQGPNVRFPAASLVPLFPSNLTARCAAPLIVRSTRTNADRRAMALCACGLLAAWALAVLVRGANRVPNIPPPRNRDGSAPSVGPWRLILSRLLLCLPPHHLPGLRLPPCSGPIGRAVLCADRGLLCLAA